MSVGGLNSFNPDLEVVIMVGITEIPSIYL